MPNIVFSLRKSKRSKKLLNIRRSMHKLEGQSTKVGYFAEQGKHPVTHPFDNPPYSYPALANALERGWFPLNDPAFQLRQPLRFMHPIVDLAMKDRRKAVVFNRPFKKWRKNLHKATTPDLVLDAIGKLTVLRAKKVFGNPAYFTNVPQNKTPVLETGDLLKKYSFKTSLNKTLRKK